MQLLKDASFNLYTPYMYMAASLVQNKVRCVHWKIYLLLLIPVYATQTHDTAWYSSQLPR